MTLDRITAALNNPSSPLRCIAQAAHEANRAYCQGIGDLSQVTWDEAPEWQRRSALNGVSGALSGFTPEELHASWSREKIEEGWAFGATKDAAAKTHPCLVPYAELPDEQRRKDSVYLAVVLAMAAALGVETTAKR